MKGREFFLLLQNPGRKVSRQTESDKPTPGAPGRGGSEEGRGRHRSAREVLFFSPMLQQALRKCSFWTERPCLLPHPNRRITSSRREMENSSEKTDCSQKRRLPHKVSTQLFGTSLSYMKSQPSSDIRRSLGREEKDQNIQISGKKKGGKSKKCSRWEKTSRDQGLNPQG